VKGVLANVLRDEAVIIRLVTFVRPSASDSTARGSKRTKVDGCVLSPRKRLAAHFTCSTSFVVPGDDQLSSLILIAEVLSTISLPASLDLISSLLETLSAVAQTASGLEGESAYAQQLLMNTIEAAASPVLVRGLTPGRPFWLIMMCRRPRRLAQRWALFGWMFLSNSSEVGSSIATSIAI
jgi:U3 small nucleolar RNA-associated protein 10